MACDAHYPLREGILDFLGNTPDEIITPFQRLMQASPIVFIYEKLWRRIGYYLASSRAFNREVKTVLHHGKAKKASRILDLACGTGVFTRPLARQASRLVVGLDLSRPMLRRAQRLAENRAIRNIFFVRATAFSMPFADAVFPHVNCCGALHLFDRVGLVLRTEHRDHYAQIVVQADHAAEGMIRMPRRS